MTCASFSLVADSELKAVFQETREGSFWSFLSGSGNFKESSFKVDLQRLTYFYLDHGFVKFRYENPVVTVSDDKRFLFISIYVDEGDQYDQSLAKGFVEIWGMPAKIAAKRDQKLGRTHG